jgi:hypothetical protein
VQGGLGTYIEALKAAGNASSLVYAASGIFTYAKGPGKKKGKQRMSWHCFVKNSILFKDS